MYLRLYLHLICKGIYDHFSALNVCPAIQPKASGGGASRWLPLEPFKNDTPARYSTCRDQASMWRLSYKKASSLPLWIGQHLQSSSCYILPRGCHASKNMLKSMFISWMKEQGLPVWGARYSAQALASGLRYFSSFSKSLRFLHVISFCKHALPL